ncbi:hypothetical protein [Priestia megaterium]
MERKEEERVNEWLVQCSEEFRECLRQFFRLQSQAGECSENN